jgi:hypothetical protein
MGSTIAETEYILYLTDLTMQYDRLIDVLQWCLVIGALMFGALVASAFIKGMNNNA